MSRIAYHSRRAMEEFDAGMAAPSKAAADAHLRLSSLHMAELNQLQHEVTSDASAGPGQEPASARRARWPRTAKAADRGQD